MGGTVKDLVAKQFDEAMVFRSSLDRETDRGVALICAAYVEDQLKELLEGEFVDLPKVVDNLFNHNGPLGTFSAKIDICLVMGLIGQDMHRGLHLIRKIRNTFAHFHWPRSFVDQDIAAQCRELYGSIAPLLECEKAREIFINCSMSSIAIVQVGILRAQHTPLSTSRRHEKPGMGMETLHTRMKQIAERLPEERVKRLNNPETRWEEYRLLLIDAMAMDYEPAESVE